MLLAEGVDSVLALHLSGEIFFFLDFFSLLLSSWTVLRSNPFSASPRDFANAVQGRPKPKHYKKLLHKNILHHLSATWF